MKDNTVFVGNKPVMNYVLAVVTQFNNGAEEVAIKARGKAISRAVDTAEIALNRFLENVSKKGIFTSTEMIDTDTGKTNVSSIEIVLTQLKCRINSFFASLPGVVGGGWGKRSRGDPSRMRYKPNGHRRNHIFCGDLSISLT